MRRLDPRFPFYCVVPLALLAHASDTRAEEKPAESADTVAKPAPQIEKIAESPACPAAVAPICKPAPLAVYVEDWDRLAALTRMDPEVHFRADFWAERHQSSNWVLVAGLFLGGGSVALGALDRLSTGSWTARSEWSVGGGISVALLSVLANWAFAPDRDDLLTVINQWNLRHPDLPLAP